MEIPEKPAERPRATLNDISAFLSIHNDDKDASSLEDRTNCAIILLESLPCTRYAVLEKIGEVFFDEAQKYVIELEKQHLSNMPAIYEANASSTLDVQIRKIQQVLVSFVDGNPKAWGPMIFQWAVQTLSQICGQYATKRQFSTMSMEERFQMWLNCTATSVLLEITVSCLNKILDKKNDNYMRCLLGMTLASVPHFNWVLAHLCCVFPNILPYHLLSHAAEAFSKQSRKIEVIVDTMLAIFRLLHGQKQKFITDALFDLFTENLVEEKEKHVVLCTIPFLLHLCNKSVSLAKPLIEKVLASLTHDNLHILQQQSIHRDEMLQCRCVNMVADCIQELDVAPNKILQFLVKYACQEDDVLIEDNPTLAASTQSFCSLVLETIGYVCTKKINVFMHFNRCQVKNQNTEMPQKIPFLNALGKYICQLCKQMMASTGTKRDVLLEVLKLVAMQEGTEVILEILIYVLMNSPIYISRPYLMYLLQEFQIYEPLVVKKLFERVFKMIASSEEYSSSQLKLFLKNLLWLDKEKKNPLSIKLSGLSYVRPYLKCLAQIVVNCVNKEDMPVLALNILQKIGDEGQQNTINKNIGFSNLPISEYAIIVQAIVSYYYNTIKKVYIEGDVKQYWDKFDCCNQLLLKTISQYVSVHQYMIRISLECIIRKHQEEFATSPEEPLIKVELLKQNLDMAQGNRFNTITSVTFKDGLKLAKKGGLDFGHWKHTPTRQLFINTLASLLSLSGYGSKMAEYQGKGNKFTHHWGEKKYMLLYPAAHAYTATVLVELVCPEMVPVIPWPDEELLKYTIERDLKVKNAFDNQPVLWDILDLISSSRPSLYHCSVLIQSLLGMSLKFWQTNRNLSTTSCSSELTNICRLMHILRNAGWLPAQIDTISDIFSLIKPKEVYDILSAVWTYCKNTSYTPDRFIDRDKLGLPTVPINTECLQCLKGVIQVVFLRNIVKLGHMYHRFFREQAAP